MNVGGFLKSEISSDLLDNFFLLVCQILINFSINKFLIASKQNSKEQQGIQSTSMKHVRALIGKLAEFKSYSMMGLNLNPSKKKSDFVVKVIPKHFPSLSDPTA